MTRYIGSRLMQTPNFIWAALVTLIVIFFFGKAVYAIDDYPNTVMMGGEADKNSGWYKQCISVKDMQPPQTDLPPLKSSSTVKCNSIDLYYETKNSKQNRPPPIVTRKRRGSFDFMRRNRSSQSFSIFSTSSWST